MNPGDPISVPPSLVDRVKNILLKPKEEWPRIDAEPATIGSIYTSYVIPLAAIPAVATFIGMFAVGVPFFGRMPLSFALGTAITNFVLTLIGVYLLSLLIDWLAPTFGATKNALNAFKVAAYSYTAAWVGGIFMLLPALGVLSLIASFYSLYLLYLGLPVLMKVAQDKALSYTVVVVIAGIVLSIVIATLTSTVSGTFMPRPELSGTINVPGAGSVDLAKLEQAAKQMEASTKKMETAAATGTSTAVAPDALQGLLPDSIGSYHRTSIESQSMGAAGVGGSQAEARYEAGDRNFRLSITDIAAMGGLAAMGAALNIQSNKQTENGYEKTSTVDGRLINEKWSKDGSGEYGMLVNSRFMVQAEGTVASIDELKGAVASVGLGKLESMAN